MNKELFDHVIHAPIRLQICAFLTPIDAADFPTLRKALEVSDSVLSKHIKQLESAGYLNVKKVTTNGRQKTWLSLSTEGKEAFNTHVQVLKSLIGSN